MVMEKEDNNTPPTREYEKSGIYLKDGKSFRLVALLMYLLGVVGFIALSAYVLNVILL